MQLEMNEVTDKKDFIFSQPLSTFTGLINFLSRNVNLERYHLHIDKNEEEKTLAEALEEKIGVIKVLIVDSKKNNEPVFLIEFDADSKEKVRIALPKNILWLRPFELV